MPCPCRHPPARRTRETDSNEDAADLYYDWDVLIAEHVSGFKVYFKNKHGKVGKGGWFDSQEEAAEAVAGFESDTHVADAWIVPYTGPGPWEYLNTFDKRVEAEAIAETAALYGFYTKVRRVHAFPSTVP